jgi:histone deacetylase 6
MLEAHMQHVTELLLSKKKEYEELNGVEEAAAPPPPPPPSLGRAFAPAPAPTLKSPKMPPLGFFSVSAAAHGPRSPRSSLKRGN